MGFGACILVLAITLACGSPETMVVKERPSSSPQSVATIGRSRGTSIVVTLDRSSATPTPTIGAIPPARLAAADVTLKPTDAPPLISSHQAMQVIGHQGIPWALGNSWNGLPITVTAAYGVGTIAGLQHVPLPGNKMLDRVVEVPMWIIDYGSTGPLAYGGGCPGCPPDEQNHAVYAVDAESRSILVIWAYNDPENPAGRAATPDASSISQ